MAHSAFQAMVRDAVGRIGLWNGPRYLPEPRISSSIWYYRRDSNGKFPMFDER